MGLHRPYIRKSVRMEVERRAMKNEQGQFLDANTGKPIVGKYDLGHKYGHEYRIALREAERQGMSQKEFNDQQNDPNILQLENSDSNRGHQFEKKDEEQEESAEEKTGEEAVAEEAAGEGIGEEGGEAAGEDNGADGGEDGGMDGGMDM